jgi:hypothetical protein
VQALEVVLAGLVALVVVRVGLSGHLLPAAISTERSKRKKRTR